MINKNTFIYGFAVFSMFFGSGNLVFPLEIGRNAGNFWFIAFWGLFLSAVLLPFLGLFVIKLYQGSYQKFFGEIGEVPGTMIAIFTLSLLGSFGVVPRCITVAHAGIGFLFPEVSLLVFSLIFSILCYLACLKDSMMIAIIGKWMTPVLLFLIFLLITCGVFNSTHVDYKNQDSMLIFQDAIFRGYQTMDLFAAFFFASVIFKEIQSKLPAKSSDKEVIRAALGPSIIGAILLGLTYMGFVYLGSHYEMLIYNVSSEMILPTIAMNILGEHAAFIISVIIIFSCMTTAIALNNIYARYISSKLKFSERNYHVVLFCTTFVSFLISLLDFKGISGFLAPALQISYPSLIVLTIFGIFFRQYKKMKLLAFYLTLLISFIVFI